MCGLRAHHLSGRGTASRLEKERPNVSSHLQPRISELADKIALELVFAEAGKDAGLLPVNSLLSEIEEAADAGLAPERVREAVKLARQSVDAALEAGALDAAAIKGLGAWCGWMRAALEADNQGQPMPGLPAGAGGLVRRTRRLPRRLRLRPRKARMRRWRRWTSRATPTYCGSLPRRRGSTWSGLSWMPWPWRRTLPVQALCIPCFVPSTPSRVGRAS